MAYNLCLAGNAEAIKNMQQLGDEFTAECFGTAHQLLERLRSGSANLLLLDSDLPDMPGMELLRVIRETVYGRDLPVIFISMNKTKESLAAAFGLGVDDYLQKPFDIRELRVRVRAVLRRRYEAMEHWGGPLSVGNIEIDPSQRRCLVDGERVTLRPLEFAVLEILMLKAGRVLSRNYLLNNIWHSASSADIRAVDTVVSRLRKALGRYGKMIETVSKMGYYLAPPPETGRKTGRREQ
ncbi:MAG: response regulator transcription factor [Elusimicrobiota bacterium]|nr:response regulator transcription factor [Elusimicrobiota bacterium]